MESGHYVINILQSSCFKKCVPCLNKALQYQSILLSKCFYVSMLLAGVMSVWYILCVVFSREIQEPPRNIITSYCMIYDTWWGSTDWYWNMDTSATTKHQKKPFCVNLPLDLFFLASSVVLPQHYLAAAGWDWKICIYYSVHIVYLTFIARKQMFIKCFN